jgi:hypothetical protein
LKINLINADNTFHDAHEHVLNEYTKYYDSDNEEDN